MLATNTSYLDIDALAASIDRPADVIGLHFFSPANVMKLLEIVVPARVSADVVATAFALAKQLKKTPVRAGVCDGFIGNRILAVYRTAADYLMEDGASPYQIDRAVREFGFPMGPFQVVDLAGGDIGWRPAAARRRATRVRATWRFPTGCASAAGSARRRHAATTCIRTARVSARRTRKSRRSSRKSARRGVTPRTFTDDEILRRYLAAMINEGANVVHEKIALRPLDVDAVFLHGYGFPRYRGGPMHYADTVGLANVLADIRAFAKEDPLFWKPSPLLVDLVARGADFASLNRID